MTKSKSNFLLLGAMLLCFCAFAQGTVTVPTDTWSDYLLQMLKANWFYLATIIYEIVIRIVPTGKTYSIITFVFRMLSSLVPDKTKGGGTFGVFVLMLAFGAIPSFLNAQNTNRTAMPSASFYKVSEIRDAVEGNGQIGLSSNWNKPGNRNKSVASKILSLDTLAAAGLLGGGGGGATSQEYAPNNYNVKNTDFYVSVSGDNYLILDNMDIGQSFILDPLINGSLPRIKTNISARKFFLNPSGNISTNELAVVVDCTSPSKITRITSSLFLVERLGGTNVRGAIEFSVTASFGGGLSATILSFHNITTGGQVKSLQITKTSTGKYTITGLNPGNAPLSFDRGKPAFFTSNIAGYYFQVVGNNDTFELTSYSLSNFALTDIPNGSTILVLGRL